MIVEDLSVPSPIGTLKPYVSFDSIPQRIRARLRPNGLVITNLLPLPGTEWDSMYRARFEQLRAKPSPSTSTSTRTGS